MKKRYIILSILLIVLALICFSPKTQAANLDYIEEFNITVDPRMNDGTLDIIYEIKWKVLDSTTEGPLEWVKIGVPNKEYEITGKLTNNIKSMTKYSSDYVRIDFDRPYEAGEIVTFKYSIHQAYMYKLSWKKCKYEFTPAWFTDAEVGKIKIRWNADSVTKSNSNSKEDNYLVWERENLVKGEKVKTKIEYPQDAFTALPKNRQRKMSINPAIIVYSIIMITAITTIIYAISSRRWCLLSS